MNVQITIRGRQFTVRTPEDGSAIRAAAEELDQRLTEQVERARTFDEHSVVVITALNLVSELQQLRKDHHEQLAELYSEVEELEKMIGKLSKEK